MVSVVKRLIDKKFSSVKHWEILITKIFLTYNFHWLQIFPMWKKNTGFLFFYGRLALHKNLKQIYRCLFHLVATHRWQRPHHQLSELHVYIRRILQDSKPYWLPPLFAHTPSIPGKTPSQWPLCHCQWSDTQTERRGRSTCRRDRSLCSSSPLGLPRCPWSGSRSSRGASRFWGSRGKTLIWSQGCATVRLWLGIRHRDLPKETVGIWQRYCWFFLSLGYEICLRGD